MSVRRLAGASLVGALAFFASAAQLEAQLAGPGALFGFRFGGAQHQSAYVDLMHTVSRNSQEWDAITFELEGGRTAGQLGLGYAGAAQMTPVYHLQGVVMRTWKKATDLAPAQTYVGVETQVSAFIGMSYGWYWRVNGSAPGQARYHAVRFVVGI